MFRMKTEMKKHVIVLWAICLLSVTLMKCVGAMFLIFPLLLCAEQPPSLDEQLFGLAGGSNYVVWCKSEGYQEFSRKVFVFLGAEFSCVNSAGDTSGDKLLYRIMMLKDNLENGVSGSGVRQTIEEVRSWIVSKFPNPSFPTVNQLLDGRIGFSAENVDGQGWNVECYAIRSNGCWRVVCDCVNDLHKQGKSASCEVMRSSEDGFEPGATKDFRPYFSRLCESDSVRRDGVLRVLFEQIGDGDYEVWRKNGCKFMPGKFLDPFTNTVVTTGSSARGRSVAVTSVRMEATIEIDEFEEAICIARSLHFLLGRRIPKANFSIEEKRGCSYVVNYPCADRFGWTLRISAERVNRSNKVAFTLELDGRGTAEDVQKVADK